MLKDALARIDRSYTIATTLRSGSNHLCDLLAQARIGNPTEHFQYTQPRFKTEDLESVLSDVLQANTVNGTFGSKMFHDHRAWLEHAFSKVLGRNVLIDGLLPSHHWIRLVRRDKVAQAVSLFKAMRTQQWLVLDNAEKNERRPEVPYDFDGILASFHQIATGELAWDAYLSSALPRHEPLEVIYEDLAWNPGAVIDSIAAFIEIPDRGRYDELDPKFHIQRNDNSGQLADRFTDDLKRTGSPP